MASLMSLLTGHRPGAFEGFQMKDLFDKERWDREQRTWSGQRTPTGPSDLRTNRAGEPMMTNWYKGRGAPEEVNSRNMMDRVMPSTPNRQMVASTRAYQPSNVGPGVSLMNRTPAPSTRGYPTREEVPAIGMGRGIRPNLIPHLSEYPGQNTMRNLGVYNPIGADTVATEEGVEAMNAYRSQMLTDLLAETSEEPEVKAISYYKKKKRSPKTYRSKSRGYRLKRI